MIVSRKSVAMAVALALGATLAACRGSSFSEMSARRAPDAPRAVFPETEYNFGEVSQGEEVRHVFKVRNEGQGVLQIKNVRGS